MNKSTAREKGFFIIATDDGDRYLYEVYANNEMEYIATSRQEAEEKLEELYTQFNS